MAPNLPEFYAIDESANFISTNAKTQKDILYIERDTGKFKLGTGERYSDVAYRSQSVDVKADAEVLDYLSVLVKNETARLSFEPSIDKKTAFNKDFGRTVDTIPPGKHGHDVSEIKGLVIPAGVSLPDKSKGYVYSDDGTFTPIPVDASPIKGSKSSISSNWAASHEASPSHVSPQDKESFHPPTTAGRGIEITDQKISIKFGSKSNEASPGNHSHDGFANKSHSHNDTINPDRLPDMSKTSRGAVPPAGNPSGRVLLDNGTWGLPNSLSIIQVDPAFVMPCGGNIEFVSSFSGSPENVVSIFINGKQVISMTTNVPRYGSIWDVVVRKDIKVSPGDVISATSPISVGIVLQR